MLTDSVQEPLHHLYEPCGENEAQCDADERRLEALDHDQTQDPAHRRTKRRFDPNVQKKTYYVPSLRRNVTLTLSAKGIKVIDARGIESVVKDVLARGVKI